LTKGRCHATDPSNASRTLLFNIHAQEWDDELLRLLDIPRAMLPQVRPSSGVIADIDPEWIGGGVPLAGIAGDQQAAAFGQACFAPGSVKNTYGTGCFVLMNVGETPVLSKAGLLTTIGWRIGDETTYFLEGAIFVAGAVVQWLRDKLGIIRTSVEVETLAAQVPDSGGVYFVPAFVGLGAPDWDAYARGTIIGIDRSTTAAHIARAALESMAYQTRDIVHAEEADAGMELSVLKVDGGASKNNLLMQFQADLLGATLRRPKVAETTALGAAYLAGLAVGYWNDLGDITANWALDREFTPQLSREDAQALYERWREAVKRSRGWVI
jgi:glycerol kinase